MLQLQADPSNESAAEELLSILGAILAGYAARWELPGQQRADTRQDLSLYLLRKIVPSYDPAKLGPSGPFAFVKSCLRRQLITQLAAAHTSTGKGKTIRWPEPNAEGEVWCEPSAPADEHEDPDDVRRQLDAIEPRLTPLEWRVWRLLRKGLSQEEVVRQTGLGQKCVDNCQQRVARKFRDPDARLQKRQCKKDEAKALRDRGLGYRDIAETLNMSVSTVRYIVDPAAPRRSKLERKLYNTMRAFPRGSLCGCCRIVGCQPSTGWYALQRLARRSGGTWDNKNHRIVRNGRTMYPLY